MRHAEKTPGIFPLCLSAYLFLTFFLTGSILAGERKGGSYPVHRDITVTVFWIGEKTRGACSRSNNTMSAWDKRWVTHYGGVDTPHDRFGYFPSGFFPKENPFYAALPYNDFRGRRKRSAYRTVYWAKEKKWKPWESMCKNRWIKIMKNGRTAYAQWEDVGPFLNDDAAYVFGTARPRNPHNHHAGLDVSPAVRDYLHLSGVDTVDWQFVSDDEVPEGPWKVIVTTSQTCWK